MFCFCFCSFAQRLLLCYGAAAAAALRGAVHDAGLAPEARGESEPLFDFTERYSWFVVTRMPRARLPAAAAAVAAAAAKEAAAAAAGGSPGARLLLFLFSLSLENLAAARLAPTTFFCRCTECAFSFAFSFGSEPAAPEPPSAAPEPATRESWERLCIAKRNLTANHKNATAKLALRHWQRARAAEVPGSATWTHALSVFILGEDPKKKCGGPGGQSGLSAEEEAAVGAVPGGLPPPPPPLPFCLVPGARAQAYPYATLRPVPGGLLPPPAPPPAQLPFHLRVVSVGAPGAAPQGGRGPWSRTVSLPLSLVVSRGVRVARRRRARCIRALARRAGRFLFCLSSRFCLFQVPPAGSLVSAARLRPSPRLRQTSAPKSCGARNGRRTRRFARLSSAAAKCKKNERAVELSGVSATTPTGTKESSPPPQRRIG